MPKVGVQKAAEQEKRHAIPPEVAQCGSHTINTMLFEMSSHVHSDGFWMVLGYLFGSLLVTLGPKWTLWGYPGSDFLFLEGTWDLLEIACILGFPGILSRAGRYADQWGLLGPKPPIPDA